MIMSSNKTILLTLCLTSYALYAATTTQPAWDDTLDFKAIEHRLLTEKVIKRTSIRAFLKKQGKTAAGTHPVDIVELESGLLGVFKREKACYGEVAAYKGACALGLRLVPPTVLRTIDGIQGSLQFYVQSPIDLMRGAGALRKISQKEASDMNIFYFVMGQWDDHNGNQIVAKSKDSYHVALIDNGGILRRQYAQYGKSTFLQKGSPKKGDPSVISNSFPFDKVTTIGLHNSKQVAQLENLLAKDYIQKLKLQRRTLSYVVWNSMVFVKQGTPPEAKTYYASTVDALKKLDRKTLEDVWAEYMPIDSIRCNDLIDLTLARRDQVIAAAEKSKKHIIQDRK
jgi:hypothetical protein